MSTNTPIKIKIIDLYSGNKIFYVNENQKSGA